MHIQTSGDQKSWHYQSISPVTPATPVTIGGGETDGAVRRHTDHYLQRALYNETKRKMTTGLASAVFHVIWYES
jgi:hypothetical protein